MVKEIPVWTHTCIVARILCDGLIYFYEVHIYLIAASFIGLILIQFKLVCPFISVKGNFGNL